MRALEKKRTPVALTAVTSTTWHDCMMVVCLLKYGFIHHVILLEACTQMYPDVSHHLLQLMGNRNRKQNGMLRPPIDFKWNFCSETSGIVWRKNPVHHTFLSVLFFNVIFVIFRS